MNILKNWLLSFDHNEDTGPDYKKLTAFWFVILSTIMIISYSLESIKLWWFGVNIVFRKDLLEFKWVLGIVLSFILILIYFTNHKTLTQFIYKIKGNEKLPDNNK